MDFTSMDVTHLQESIPDFQPYLHTCRFRDCIHVKEPGCAIQEAVEEGKIRQERYDHYLEIVDMIQHAKVKY